MRCDRVTGSVWPRYAAWLVCICIGSLCAAAAAQAWQGEAAPLPPTAGEARFPGQVAALQDAGEKGPQGATESPDSASPDPADSTERDAAALDQPFSVRSALDWLAEHGLPIVLTLAVLVVVLWAANLLESRLVPLLLLRRGGASNAEVEARARTLVSVLHNTLRTVAIGVAAVMILDECGVPVGPILGGAAVVGLAVAFGAQSLIKDYFTGFIVLLEQQYMIGDVIKIADVTAQVERITLRMTVLRDLEGKVHFIPHGQITTVTNLTHDWSRAVLDIGVAYKEDTDRVMGELMEIARALRQDPAFADMLLDDPVMLGVDGLGDSAVVIKFMIKTRPIKQWDVKRELLRRIKRRFDELSIEIPFPHQTLYLGNPPAAWTDAGGRSETARPNQPA